MMWFALRFRIILLTIVCFWLLNSKVVAESIIFKDTMNPNDHRIMKIQEEFYDYQMRVVIKNEERPNENNYDKDGVGKLDIRVTYGFNH